MSMIKCPECGKEISDKAVSCPNCGCPASSMESSKPIFKDDEIDIEPVANMYRNNKVNMIKHLMHNNGLGMTEAKKKVDFYFQTYTKPNKNIDLSNNISKLASEKSKMGSYDDNAAHCPKCGCTSITYVEKKLSIGRAVVGSQIAGGVGAILGGQSSKKGKAKCLKCGHMWKI